MFRYQVCVCSLPYICMPALWYIWCLVYHYFFRFNGLEGPQATKPQKGPGMFPFARVPWLGWMTQLLFKDMWIEMLQIAGESELGPLHKACSCASWLPLPSHDPEHGSHLVVTHTSLLLNANLSQRLEYLCPSLLLVHCLGHASPRHVLRSLHRVLARADETLPERNVPDLLQHLRHLRPRFGAHPELHPDVWWVWNTLRLCKSGIMRQG